jgi:membrane-associated phospholipid phosphatase
MLVAYLGLTLIPAVPTARSPGSSFILVAHVAGLGLAVYAARRLGYHDASGQARGARVEAALAWLPVVAVPLLYAELPALMAGIGSTYHDATVQQWELELFGGSSPARSFAPAIARATPPVVTLAISEVLHAGYLSFYAIIYLPVVILFARGDREKFGRTVTGLTTIFAATYVVFVLFPVQGPRYLWPAPTAIPHGLFRALTLRVLEGGSSPGTAFPSAHVAVATMQSLFALQWHRPFGILLSVLTALLTLGAVYGGYHYAVDVLAGAVVGLVAGFALRRAGTASAP